MSQQDATTRTSFAVFVGVAVAVTALLVLAGWAPTRRLAGDGGPPAMVVACGISLLASLGAGLYLSRIPPTGAVAVSGPLLAMGLRLAVVAALGALVGLVTGLPGTALLSWLAISYLALLAVDTWYALSVVRHLAARREPPPSLSPPNPPSPNRTPISPETTHP